MKRESPPYVFESVLLGYIAMWATRQSPYHSPDGLPRVLADVQTGIAYQRHRGIFEFPHTDTVSADRDSLNMLLRATLLQHPQVHQWNERKNGNESPYGFVSRYNKPNPDDDFIDLDALVGNIVRSCIKHDREAWEEHEASMRWSLGRAWRNLKLRLFPPQGLRP